MLMANFVANSIVEPIYAKTLQKIEKTILHEAGRGFINCHFSDVSLSEAPEIDCWYSRRIRLRGQYYSGCCDICSRYFLERCFCWRRKKRRIDEKETEENRDFEEIESAKTVIFEGRIIEKNSRPQARPWGMVDNWEMTIPSQFEERGDCQTCN